MIPVSQQYKDAIYAPSRSTKGKVIFQIVDTTAKSDATPTATSEASISKLDQIVNTNLEMSGKYATFEPDYWLLDGSFVLPPKSTETGSEVGWWSDAICGEDGRFGAYVEPMSFLSFGLFSEFFDLLPIIDPYPQLITVTFTQDHTSIGLTITFDTQTNEYAEEFTIDVYDSSNVLIYTEAITENNLVKYILEHTLENYRKIVVTITKWGTGYRRARVTEISFGVVYEYGGNELISTTILEEIDTLSNQVSSNEINFTLDNQDKRFNILNPNGVYPALQRRQKINPYLGVVKTGNVVENVPMGVYYLSEWKSDEGTLTASFTARDILDIIAQSDYAGDAFVATSLYDVAEAVLVSAEVTDYSIDVALQSIFTSGSLAKMKHREALQLIAIAGMAVVYSDRLGKVIIKQLSNTVLDEIIDFDNIYKSPQIKLDTLINTIYIKSGETTYTYTDPAKPTNEQILSVEINNSLVSDSTMAENISVWILAEYKKRFLYEIPWRMNPALECGDIVTVEDDYSENKTVRLTKQEFTYAGYLIGKTNGKGGGT